MTQPGAYMVRRPHEEKDISSCGLTGFINRDGTLVDGQAIARSIGLMRDRGNGLGGGFAAYGIYRHRADDFALHVMYDDEAAKDGVEELLKERVNVLDTEPLPTRKTPVISKSPLFFRYFTRVPDGVEEDEQDYMLEVIMSINVEIDGAFVMSSGKNMGVFKGVGFPEDLADFFRLDEYDAYLWTAHNRFPTNTPGWWGGAHPFALLDWSIVHNGEISSYGTNRRYVESFGYRCTLRTDTEVVAYLFDLLVRRHGLSFERAGVVMAPPFWDDITRMDEVSAKEATDLRTIYASAQLNGPFAFLFGFNGGLIGLNDRIKLRPLVVAEKGETVYMSSEEAAIRVISDDLDSCYSPVAGEPIIATLNNGVA
ncbi:MAG: glutamine amidotransferase family protein [Candidatus Latescibacteria bacterium]|nr:glutamine amidotransferase family protein [Candidatus Latescibacterota bacterium]